MHQRAAYNLILFVMTVTLIPKFMHAQVVGQIVQETRAPRNNYPISGSFFLQKQKKEIRNYLIQHPEALQTKGLRKTTNLGFTVGSTKSWYADSIKNDGTTIRYQVPSTCRAVGTHCYVFVEDASWNLGRVDQTAVDSVIIYFDQKTPANPLKGIYQMNTEAFGDPPDVDGDPKIVILLLDIKDGYNGSGGYVAGYFYSFNEIPKSFPGHETSNEAEIYFLDTNPLNLKIEWGLQIGISTTAHEFQHMINFNYDPYQRKETFIDEGCSLVAEVNCGFPIFDQTYYCNNTNQSLFLWHDDFTQALPDYSRAARFFVYIKDQFGMGIFRYIVAYNNNASGTDCINTALTQVGSSLRFNNVLTNWSIANILDDRNVDSTYGYKYRNLLKVKGFTYYQPNIASTTNIVQNYGVQYLSYKAGSGLRASFSFYNNALSIKAIEIGTASKRVVDVVANTYFTEPLFGTTYNEIHFAVINTNSSSPISYSYQSQGTKTTVEQKWDQQEPIGLLNSSANDTVCVTFDAFPGARLDSIRVAVRTIGSATGGIYVYSGSPRPTPLGKKLAFPITVSSDYDTPVINPDSTFPFPIPYPNWRTIDLRSYNIIADHPFAAAFSLGNSQYTPGFVVTKYPGSDPFHSYTYLNNATNGSNWYYITNTNSDSVWVYLMRAYLSYDSTLQQIVAEPKNLKLSQNFPNPARQQTTIRYQLPQPGYVTVTLYDVLGRVVAIPVSGYRDSQDETINLGNLPSGVYFYQIKTGGIVETKKLILLK